jgi:hypothetical protein
LSHSPNPPFPTFLCRLYHIKAALSARRWIQYNYSIFSFLSLSHAHTHTLSLSPSLYAPEHNTHLLTHPRDYKNLSTYQPNTPKYLRRPLVLEVEKAIMLLSAAETFAFIIVVVFSQILVGLALIEILLELLVWGGAVGGELVERGVVF